MSLKQKQQTEKAIQKCLNAVQSDKLKNGMAEASVKTAATCQKELRKIEDSRGLGKSQPERAEAAMMKACDPTGKAFTDEDVVEEMVDDKVGLGAAKLAAHCSQKAGVSTIDSVAKLVECVVKSNTKDATEGIKSQNAKAPADLKEVREMIAELPPSAKDPTAGADAVGALDDTLAEIDPDGDGVPNARPEFNGAARLVFVSSNEHTGNVGGWAGAVERCGTLAAAGTLPGQFMPWLSADAKVAADELDGLTQNGGIPYVTLKGTLVANNIEGFVNGSLVSPINVDEAGAVVPDAPVWTGTLASGDADSARCFGFTSDALGEPGLIGRTSRSDSGWTAASLHPCSLLARIYCVEVDLAP